MMRWKKLGLIFCPDGSLGWAKSHAMIPTPVRLNDDVLRVFVTFCDDHGRGRPGYVDLSITDPFRVLDVTQTPLLELGLPGTFDENGVLACSVVDVGNGKIHLYYAGFELGTKIRYRLLTGLAVSLDGGKTFKRNASVPILERSSTEMFFRGGPYCYKEAGIFKLWYVGGSEWVDLDGKSMPVYNIRYAESSDGVRWPDQGEVQIEITDPDEHGFGRPCVIPKPSGGYRMFYSVRRRSINAYRLGYAESKDGRCWTRMDRQLNLDVTAGEFDSNAIMYAAPIEVNGKLYVFYNGNEFGLHGFGAAELESE